MLSIASNTNPVYTICLYRGKGIWTGTGPKSLKDMMDFQDDMAWQAMFVDYPLLLVNVEDEDLAEKCHTDLKQFLKALAARRDKRKMRELLGSEEFRKLNPETDRTLAVMLDIKPFISSYILYLLLYFPQNMCYTNTYVRAQENICFY